MSTMPNKETKADKVARLILSADEFVTAINVEIKDLIAKIQDTKKGDDDVIFIAKGGKTAISSLSNSQIAYYYTTKASQLDSARADKVFQEWCELAGEDYMTSVKVLTQEVSSLAKFMLNTVKRDKLEDELSDKQWVKAHVQARKNALELLQTQLNIAPEGLIEEMDEHLS